MSQPNSANLTKASIKERKFPRRSFQKKIGILCAGEYFLGQAVDLGEGGISFLTDRVMNQDQGAIISFQIPSGDFVFVKSSVNTTHRIENHFRVGMAFHSLDFSCRRQIRLYVSGRV